MAGVVDRADAFQRRHPWAGFPLAVVYKFADDQGAYLTALMTYYGFLSLFPMLLLLVSGLGYVLQGDPQAQARVLDSAVAGFPVIGDQLTRNVHSFHGSLFGLVTGVLLSLYGGLGVIQATQNALNKLWGVPRLSRPDPIRSRLRSLLLMFAGLAAILATAAAGVFGHGLWPAAAAASVAVNTVLLTVAFRVLTARPLDVAQVRIGALVAALAWQGLQWAGATLIGHVLRNATATYGFFGIVLGLMAWIYLGALTVVLCAEINVVRDRRLWPRNLRTPFTDRVVLTKGDRRAYASYAETERHKTFERVDVDFGDRADRPDGPPPESGVPGVPPPESE
ncbi:YihY/virulence factor BrkB family protein [Actinomadura parmotrematis]|uniref:YihY/virulence factor BrkB family protein n=1 Tax=Actinomadura parmotrematis TaxID=2864039 RepID=A0ABS7FMH2_9ACTN|nr:YihY/virulence factor BrkB family protein [Actinomadura parmotrematis]MBW8481580.1 YihY/virulence factor BrkB family protein [Actinomadura parmotrematis]